METLIALLVFAWLDIKLNLISNFAFHSQAPPEGFATNLLAWTKDTFELDDAEVDTLVQNERVCKPSKGCYDPGDIGGHCCPY